MRNREGHFDLGTHALRQRPELESIIGNCLMAWPMAEAEMALLLGQLLGAQHSNAALAVFQSLRRSTAQRSAIIAAAEVALNDTDNELLGAILNVHKAIESERNALTHGHFGVYSRLEDGIIWMETQSYVDTRTRLDRYRGVLSDEELRNLYSSVSFYKAHDLQRIFEDIKELANYWYRFIQYLRSTPTQRAELYRQLCAESRIARELEKLRREKTPLAPCGSPKLSQPPTP
jgi:hypothetical protein